MLLTALRPLSSAKTTVSYITVSTGWTLTSLTRMRVGGCHRHCAREVLLALFPDLHAQLFSFATKAGHGGLGMRRRYFPNSSVGGPCSLRKDVLFSTFTEKSSHKHMKF